MKTNFLRTLRLTTILIFVTVLLNRPYALAQKTKNSAGFTITNFDNQGNQIIRYSSIGDAIDAHDGEIAFFNDMYFLYGTSYDCGFEWQNKNAAFCGFKVYTSKDMLTWTDKGYLFDAKSALWQSRCNGNTYGCFRPHVVYNKSTDRYVLWINVYDNVSGYRVFTSKSPSGPFVEEAEPKLAVNADAPAAGLNNGDHDLFVDDDGTGYIALTDWRKGGRIMIEKLSDDYLTGTGKVGQAVTEKQTEAPGMFKRNGIYYVVYSDPNCGYCAGTGASYKTSNSPFGPWTESKKINDNSCGGQPSFVSTIKLSSGNVFLFGSDLWNNAAKNEALANYFWAPLEFNSYGEIIPFECRQNFKVTGKKVVKFHSLDGQHGSVKGDIEIRQNSNIVQAFTAQRSRNIVKIEIPLYSKGSPNKGLKIELFEANYQGLPKDHAIASTILTNETIGWSIKKQTIDVHKKIIKGKSYCLLLSSQTTVGSYGITTHVGTLNTGDAALGTLTDTSLKGTEGKKLNFRLISRK